MNYPGKSSSWTDCGFKDYPFYPQCALVLDPDVKGMTNQTISGLPSKHRCIACKRKRITQIQKQQGLPTNITSQGCCCTLLDLICCCQSKTYQRLNILTIVVR